MAYEARKQYPERKVHITNEIIHNPAVNQVRPIQVGPALLLFRKHTLLGASRIRLSTKEAAQVTTSQFAVLPW